MILLTSGGSRASHREVPPCVRSDLCWCSVVPAADGPVALYCSLERPTLRAELSGSDCIENDIGRATRP